MDASRTRLFEEGLSAVVVGGEDSALPLLSCLVAGGHVLVEGPAGTGKTTLAKTFAQLVGGGFRRVQMTADTLPSDILGVHVFNQRTQSFTLEKGPVFTNILLVDELNRAPARTQSALLEAMQEKQATIEGETLPLPSPFMVVATQVPYGSPGTYPLSDVQVDRFTLTLGTSLLEPEEEVRVLSAADEAEKPVQPVFTPDEILRASREASSVYVSQAVKRYIVNIAAAFRRRPELRHPPSVRASIAIMRCSRALALLNSRTHVLPDDVKALTPLAYAHRLALTPEAEASEVNVRTIVSEVLGEVEVPKQRGEAQQPAEAPGG